MTHLACFLTVAAAVLSSASGVATLTPTVADVLLKVGSPLHLDCGVQGQHRYCFWETEDGRIFQVADVHNGRHAGLRAPHNLTHNQCGIVVEQGAATDAGTWTCRVFLQGKVLSGVKNVRKETKACHPPFEAVGDGCFYFNHELTLTWNAARTFCKDLSTYGDLAKVDDCYQLKLIWGHIVVEFGPSYFWLGGTDEHQEGIWKWVDGTAVAPGTPFWAPGEPNNSLDDENCLTIQSSTGYFNDLNCSRDYVGVLCQDKSP